VPKALEAICLKCLEKDPARRYPSANAVVEALRGWESRAAEAPSPVVVKSRGWSRLYGAALVLAGLLVLAGGSLTWLYLNQTPAPPSPPPIPQPNGSSQDPGGKGGAGEVPVPPPPQPSVPVIPKDLRKDFDLQVEMKGGHREPDGIIRLEQEDVVKFRIQVDCDAYVGIWTVNGDGTVLQLFPNKWDRDHLFRANQGRVVPESARVRAVPSRGTDRVWVQAATKPWSQPEGQPDGPFIVFKDLREQKAIEKERGLILEEPGIRLADKVLRYKVAQRR
jgi:hypothetical protein